MKAKSQNQLFEKYLHYLSCQCNDGRIQVCLLISLKHIGRMIAWCTNSSEYMNNWWDSIHVLYTNNNNIMILKRLYANRKEIIY